MGRLLFDILSDIAARLCRHAAPRSKGEVQIVGSYRNPAIRTIGIHCDFIIFIVIIVIVNNKTHNTA
jgi:hypothetical protein